MTLTESECVILIRYYAKVIVEHNLQTKELHEFINRIVELGRQIKEKD